MDLMEYVALVLKAALHIPFGKKEERQEEGKKRNHE